MRVEGVKVDHLEGCLKDLHLPTIRRCYLEEAITARRDNWDHETYLYALAVQECEERNNNRITRFLKDSKLPLEKSLQAFDRKRLPRKVDAHLNLLLKGDFLDRHENVLASEIPEAARPTCCAPSLRN